ncbi:TPA_asm: polyprotein [Guizotia virus 1]|uniref:RNA-directed RNA polymerase n=1 Tax=Guizotia virus 1 TaxID=2977969 RepID=A0A9N7AAT2_9RHAB|nr:TPA_asm: polyprotein [Guizotia virus 1]
MADFSDFFYGGLEDEIGDAPIEDEQMLLDFHLASAINLDVVEKLVSQIDPPYNLYVPFYMDRSWRELRFVIPRNHQNIVGFHDLKCRLFLMNMGSVKTTPYLYKTLVQIVGKALQARGVQIPLAYSSESIAKTDIMVQRHYYSIFNSCLKAITMLSEILRGGTHLVYGDVRTENGFTKIFLIPGRQDFELIVGRNMSAIIDHNERKNFIADYNSVLLLLDTVGQRLCMEIGCQITRLSGTKGTVEIDDLNVIYKIGDEVLRIMGNRGYEVIGLFEATVVSVILQKSPDLVTDCDFFYKNCMEELIELVEEEEQSEALIELWTNMVIYLHRLEPDILSNVFCLYRVWGHPRVDIHGGMKKVCEKGTFNKLTMGQTGNLALYQFRHMFLHSYYQKHKRYPELEIDEISNCYIIDRIIQNLPVRAEDIAYNIWDYEKIRIKQIWNIPETYDVCHILNDKAVSPTKSELFDNIRAGKGTFCGVLRRGIIRWMEGESIRCKEFLEQVDERGLDEDDLIIGMYEKEREIKVKARMFSLMSEHMRMYFVLTEELIANHVLPYFPEITMKDPLNVQVRKIWKAGGKGQHPLNPNINIDFEKWNLNMRDGFTRPIFKQMDEMFGFKNLIARTHDIFFNSYIYSSSGKYLPLIEEDRFVPDPPMAYAGHVGGFEGLRQKGWTVATVSLLAYVAWANKVRFSLLGQGDNQVLKLYMPIKTWENHNYTDEKRIEAAKRILQQYLHDMHQNFSDAGLPIKIRETWISTRLYMYGKTMYLDGENLPQWSKKLLRSYALSNEGTVTISGVIGTIATNMCASASVSEHPDIMYALFLFMAEWSLEYLLSYHPFTRKMFKPGQSYFFRIPGYENGRPLRTPILNWHRLIVSLIMVPTSVGGSVNIPLTGYIMRGFPDHVSEGYAWMKLLGSVQSPYQDLFWNWYTFLCNTSIQPDMLVQSPWSLNHLKPPTPGISSRELVRNWLLSGRFLKNQFLRNMQFINASFNRKMVCHELMSDPINPLVTYEVYNALPHTYYDSILRRFENTRSVKQLAMREKYNTPIVSKLMDLEDDYISYIIWRGERSGTFYSECATEQTRLARNKGWGRTIKGLTTPHPIEFLFDSVCRGYDVTCDHSDYILAKHTPRGDYPPYLGSRVRTKVISLQDEYARVEPLICANARLARYLKWLNAGENLFSVILQSTLSLCDINIYDNFFDDWEQGENFSGCVEHRFNPAAASDGCFINYVPQIGSKVYLSGDNMPKYGKGKVNYTLHFQAIYCFLQYVTATAPTSSSTHHHLVCESCIVECDDEIGDIDPYRPYLDQAFAPDISQILKETIGYISEKPLVLNARDPHDLPGIHMNLDDIACISTRAYQGCLLLLSVRCASAILVRGNESSGLGIEDLQAFPRVYAYKIYTDHIIRMTAKILIYLVAFANQEIPEGHSMARIKRNVKKLLDGALLENFKELGSLCLGRSWSVPSGTIEPIPCNTYPESPEDFLRQVRFVLMKTLDEINDLNYSGAKTIALPLYDCSEREFRIIVGFQLMSIRGCSRCGSICTSTQSILEHDCRDDHIKPWLNNVIIAKASLDRLMKFASVKQSKMNEIESLPIVTSTRLVSYEFIKTELNNMQTFHESRKINLPTASIYKWTAVIRYIPQKYQNVIVLGDGTGGTSFIAASHFKGAKIHPLARMEHYRAIPQDTKSISPFLSRGCKNIDVELMTSIPDDITDAHWIDMFTGALSMMKSPILVISDLERGAELILTSILPQLLNSVEFDHVIKVYSREVQFNPSWSYIVSPHANCQYGELFVTNIAGMLKIRQKEITSNVQREIKIIERVFSDCTKLSLHLSQQQMAKSYLNIKRDTLLHNPTRLVVEILRHISARYRFPRDKIRHHDRRNLTDGVLLKIVRGFKIVLLSLSGEYIMEMEWFKRLFLLWLKRNERYRGITSFKILPAEHDEDYSPLSKKDVSAARTIRNHRSERIRIESLQELYEKLIIPFHKLSSTSQISDAIWESDIIEQAEDYELEDE